MLWPSSRRLVLVAAVAMVAGGCSGAAPAVVPSAVPTVPVALPSLAIPSVAIPTFAIPSLVLPTIALPSLAIPSVALPSADKDLEARLPDTLNGVNLSKFSFKGDSLLSGPAASSTASIRDILARLGKSPADFSEAFATDPTGALKVSLGALRIVGADGGAMLNAFISASKNTSPNLQTSQASLGGKNVTVVTDPATSATGITYIYANGDTLFFAQTADPGLAATALAALP